MTHAQTWHVWQGQRLTHAEFVTRLPRLRDSVEESARHSLTIETVLRACAQMADDLRKKAPGTAPMRQVLTESLGSAAEAEEGLQEIAAFLDRPSLEAKLAREFGTRDPFTPQRFDYRSSHLECWAPLGFLLHIAPGNSFSVGVLSVVEGLLAGNLNVLKLSSADSDFPLLFLQQLSQLDPTGVLKLFIFAFRISSSDKKNLQLVANEAAGIAAWGGEEAIASIRKMAPQGARVIDWGHRLSFAYISSEILASPAPTSELNKLASEICNLEQQACASPQCIYLDTADHKVLSQFAKQLATALRAESERRGAPAIDARDAAEIAMVTAVQRSESALGLGEVIEAEDQSWRVMVDTRSSLRASPLYRSIWIKPLPRAHIFQTLWPMREFLQTVGLVCKPGELADLSRRFIAAGILRVTEAGGMLGSYNGEPHDGVYALPRYARRISLQVPTIGQGFVSFAELEPAQVTKPWRDDQQPAIMNKEDFQARKVDDAYAHLFFKSGGSSGEPKISIFTYDDYHTQMQLAAEGLFAAGLNPTTDRCMNLFFGGGLYGGFLSFFTILEHLRAVQFPMAAHMEFEFVLDMILKYRVNTIMGMPSYIVQLFNDPANAKRLKELRPIKKIFFGGEHFNQQQRELFMRDFGVEVIRSATYGSVDSGPLGYQCPHCEGSVHHLHHRLQILEILKVDRDETAAAGEIGRLVFTSLTRESQKLHRYDIGDLGRWVPGDCGCGRKAPRFELMGRHGDVFRAAGTFLNYQKICNVINDRSSYGGEVQAVIDRVERAGTMIDRLLIYLDPSGQGATKEIQVALTKFIPDLHETVESERSLVLEVRAVGLADFHRTSGSGKLRRVVDLRDKAKI